jgi:small-conductance mechanosensitive channel
MDDLGRVFSAQVLWIAARAGGALAALIGFWLAGAIVQRVTDRFYERAEVSKRDVIRLISQTAKFALIVLGVVTALGTVGVNVAALVAGLGLTGFALGFALRDALSNVLAGMLILMYRPFRRDDRIAVSGFEGLVTAVDFRYTTLETEDRRILIPNSILFTNPISLHRS